MRPPLAGVVPVQPVVRAARFALAHVPGLVLAGSKPRREIAVQGTGTGAELRARICAHLRPYNAAVAYPPHQVMLGNLPPEALWEIPRPWHDYPQSAARAEGPGGVLVDERQFYAWLARADTANLAQWTEDFAPRLDLDGLPGNVRVTMAGTEALERAIDRGAEPLYHQGCLAGVVFAAHDEDEALSAAVLLENLAAKATGALALHRLLADIDGEGKGEPVDYMLGCGEEAVGDRYQRGGGNLAKAMGELAGVRSAGGADVKSFCAAPLHALLLAGALVASGINRRVIVVGGGSLAKLGMKFRGHLASDYPILEDVLAGVAIEVVPDDGYSPVLRLDAAAIHRIGDGGAPHQLAQALTLGPLRARRLRLGDVDRYAVELHNPDITEPAGSGDVPANNYQILAALAAQAGEITREEMPAFVRAHGLPGFAPTQGHIASAIPYLPHAIAGLTTGAFTRVQFVAKGSLFLGRMTGMSDGVGLLLERNEHNSGQPTGGC